MTLEQQPTYHLLGMETCAPCQATKKFLDEHEVFYVYHDAKSGGDDMVAEMKKIMLDKGVRTVPCLFSEQYGELTLVANGREEIFPLIKGDLND